MGQLPNAFNSQSPRLQTARHQMKRPYGAWSELEEPLGKLLLEWLDQSEQLHSGERYPLGPLRLNSHASAHVQPARTFIACGDVERKLKRSIIQRPYTLGSPRAECE